MKHWILFCLGALLMSGCGDDPPAVGPTPLPAIGGGEATAPFSYSVTVAGQSGLRLEGIHGTVDIEGSTSANTVSVTGVRRVRSDSAHDAGNHLPNLEVRVNEGADVILVRTIQPEDDDRDYVVDYVITVPRELAVIVNNVNGDIGARITLPLDGTIDLATVNGGIGLSIPRNTSARLDARVSNGTVTVSNLPLRSSVQTPTVLEGTLGSGRGTISLETVNGAIELSGF